MTTESIESAIKSAIEVYVKEGKLTESNYNSSSATSKLLTEYMKTDKSGLPRSKMNALFRDIIKAHFEGEDKPEEENENDENDETEANDENAETENEAEEENNENNEEEAEAEAEPEPVKPKRSTSTTKRTGKTNSSKVNSKSSSAAASAKSFAERVKEANKKSGKTPKTKTVRATRSTVSNPETRRSVSYCRGLNIDNKASKYNVIGVKPLTSFPNEEINLEDAETELIGFFTNDEGLAGSYTSARTDYIEAVGELRDKYAINDPKGKKVQHFTITKDNIKYVDPDSLKQEDLPDEDQECFRTYENAMNEFSEAFHKSVSPDKPKRVSTKEMTKEQKEELKNQQEQAKSEERNHLLQFLLLPVIQTQNVIKIETLMKASGIYEEQASKITNTVLTPLSKEDWQRIETDKKYKPFAPDYIQLFIDIKKFNGSNYGRLCKTIYNHRDTLIKHSKLTLDMKRRAWLQSLANIKQMKKTETNNLIIDCWHNILSSEFVFKIVMLGLQPSDFFKRSFELLIQEPLSVQLFESALYPISFVFTPNMLGYSNFEAPANCFGKTDATYKKNLQIKLEEFGNPTNNNYNYESCNWLYYFNKNDVQNEMISLLHRAVELTDKEPQGDNASTTDETNDNDNNDNDENNENEDQ